MSILDKYVAFVKDSAAFQARRTEEFQTSSPTRAKRHRQTAETFEQMLVDFQLIEGELSSLREKLAASAKAQELALQQSAPAPKQLKLSLTEEDIQGLPAELINELSLSAGDRAEFAILGILEESNGISSLDRLLIGLYRKTGEIHKRKELISRLYRMVQKNLIYSVPGKKGVYSLEPPAGADTEPLDAASD